MAKLYGVDLGVSQTCRVCHSDRFLVEIGPGTINGQPGSVMSLRCPDCGTPHKQFVVDWSALKSEDKVVVADGVTR